MLNPCRLPSIDELKCGHVRVVEYWQCRGRISLVQVSATHTQGWWFMGCAKMSLRVQPTLVSAHPSFRLLESSAMSSKFSGGFTQLVTLVSMFLLLGVSADTVVMGSYGVLGGVGNHSVYSLSVLASSRSAWAPPCDCVGVLVPAVCSTVLVNNGDDLAQYNREHLDYHMSFGSFDGAPSDFLDSRDSTATGTQIFNDWATGADFGVVSECLMREFSMRESDGPLPILTVWTARLSMPGLDGERVAIDRLRVSCTLDASKQRPALEQIFFAAFSACFAIQHGYLFAIPAVTTVVTGVLRAVAWLWFVVKWLFVAFRLYVRLMRSPHQVVMMVLAYVSSYVVVLALDWALGWGLTSVLKSALRLSLRLFVAMGLSYLIFGEEVYAFSGYVFVLFLQFFPCRVTRFLIRALTLYFWPTSSLLYMYVMATLQPGLEPDSKYDPILGVRKLPRGWYDWADLIAHPPGRFLSWLYARVSGEYVSVHNDNKKMGFAAHLAAATVRGLADRNLSVATFVVPTSGAEDDPRDVVLEEAMRPSFVIGPPLPLSSAQKTEIWEQVTKIHAEGSGFHAAYKAAVHKAEAKQNVKRIVQQELHQVYTQDVLVKGQAATINGMRVHTYDLLKSTKVVDERRVSHMATQLNVSMATLFGIRYGLMGEQRPGHVANQYNVFVVVTYPPGKSGPVVTHDSRDWYSPDLAIRVLSRPMNLTVDATSVAHVLDLKIRRDPEYGLDHTITLHDFDALPQTDNAQRVAAQVTAEHLGVSAAPLGVWLHGEDWVNCHVERDLDELHPGLGARAAGEVARSCSAAKVQPRAVSTDLLCFRVGRFILAQSDKFRAYVNNSSGGIFRVAVLDASEIGAIYDKTLITRKLAKEPTQAQSLAAAVGSVFDADDLALIDPYKKLQPQFLGDTIHQAKLIRVSQHGRAVVMVWEKPLNTTAWDTKPKAHVNALFSVADDGSMQIAENAHVCGDIARDVDPQSLYRPAGMLAAEFVRQIGIANARPQVPNAAKPRPLPAVAELRIEAGDDTAEVPVELYTALMRALCRNKRGAMAAVQWMAADGYELLGTTFASLCFQHLSKLAAEERKDKNVFASSTAEGDDEWTRFLNLRYFTYRGAVYEHTDVAPHVRRVVAVGEPGSSKIRVTPAPSWQQIAATPVPGDPMYSAPPPPAVLAPDSVPEPVDTGAGVGFLRPSTSVASASSFVASASDREHRPALVHFPSTSPVPIPALGSLVTPLPDFQLQNRSHPEPAAAGLGACTGASFAVGGLSAMSESNPVGLGLHPNLAGLTGRAWEEQYVKNVDAHLRAESAKREAAAAVARDERRQQMARLDATALAKTSRGRSQGAAKPRAKSRSKSAKRGESKKRAPSVHRAPTEPVSDRRVAEGVVSAAMKRSVRADPDVTDQALSYGVYVNAVVIDGKARAFKRSFRPLEGYTRRYLYFATGTYGPVVNDCLLKETVAKHGDFVEEYFLEVLHVDPHLLPVVKPGDVVEQLGRVLAKVDLLKKWAVPEFMAECRRLAEARSRPTAPPRTTSKGEVTLKPRMRAEAALGSQVVQNGAVHVWVATQDLILADGTVRSMSASGTQYDADCAIGAADCAWALVHNQDGVTPPGSTVGPMTLTHTDLTGRLTTIVVPAEKLSRWKSPTGADTPFVRIPVRMPGFKRLKIARPSLGGANTENCTVEGPTYHSAGQVLDGPFSVTLPVIDDIVIRLDNCFAYTSTTGPGVCGSAVIQGDTQLVGVHVGAGEVPGSRRECNYFVAVC